MQKAPELTPCAPKFTANTLSPMKYNLKRCLHESVVHYPVPCPCKAEMIFLLHQYASKLKLEVIPFLRGIDIIFVCGETCNVKYVS